MAYCCRGREGRASPSLKIINNWFDKGEKPSISEKGIHLYFYTDTSFFPSHNGNFTYRISWFVHANCTANQVEPQLVDCF